MAEGGETGGAAAETERGDWKVGGADRDEEEGESVGMLCNTTLCTH